MVSYGGGRGEGGTNKTQIQTQTQKHKCHRRFAGPLGEAHAPEALSKFEELLEAAIDLERVPEEYLIAASYDAGLQVWGRGGGEVGG